ncbi:MAG: caspase family protein [Chloroflexota bacterium]
MTFEKGHALLVGVGSHPNARQLDVLETVADVQAVAQALGDEHLCGYPSGQVRVLHDQSATRQGILAGLDELAGRAGPDDTVFIFYSGHGDYGTDGAYYLVSHDARIENEKVASGTGVSQAELLEKIGKIQAQRLLLLFNACHSGQVTPATLGAAAAPALGARPLPGAAAEALLGSGSGRVVITACRQEQLSYVGDGPQTLFAQALLDALHGRTTSGRGGFISVFDLYTALYDALSEKAPQEPELTVIKGVGPFAVALYNGASQTNLGLAEAAHEPPEYTAVRRVRPEKARYQFQQHSAVHIGSISGVSGGQINIAGRDVNTRVETGGGAYVGGNVDTGGGSFVGRDKLVFGDEVRGDKVLGDKVTGNKVTGDQVAGDKTTVGDISGSTGIAIGRNAQAYVSMGVSAAELERLFQPLLAAVAQAPAQARPEAARMAEQLKQEAAKGKQADDKLMARLIEGLVDLVPGAVSAVVSAFASPLLAGIAGPVTQYVLSKWRK